MNFRQILSYSLFLSAASGWAEVPDPTPRTVECDLTRGDGLQPRGGWSFASQNWVLSEVPGTGEKGIGFRYDGRVPGNYGMSEMRFDMPAAREFWLSLRWHVPANYAHRHDTHLDMAGAVAAGWQSGDTVRGTDGVSQGVISFVDASGIYLRFADKSAYDNVWNGSVSNITRSNSLSASGAFQWPANNKLLAVWADEYSSKGLGSTIVWQIDSDWYSGSQNSVLTVGYSVGGNTGTGGAAVGGALVSPADKGRYIDLAFHINASSQPGAKDGLIDSWSRRQGSQTWVRHHAIGNADLPLRADLPDSLRYWQAGYLMGWSNSGFDSTTTFHISKLAWSNQGFGSGIFGIGPTGVQGAKERAGRKNWCHLAAGMELEVFSPSGRRLGSFRVGEDFLFPHGLSLVRSVSSAASFLHLEP